MSGTTNEHVGMRDRLKAIIPERLRSRSRSAQSGAVSPREQTNPRSRRSLDVQTTTLPEGEARSIASQHLLAQDGPDAKSEFEHVSGNDRKEKLLRTAESKVTAVKAKLAEEGAFSSHAKRLAEGTVTILTKGAAFVAAVASTEPHAALVWAGFSSIRARNGSLVKNIKELEESNLRDISLIGQHVLLHVQTVIERQGEQLALGFSEMKKEFQSLEEGIESIHLENTARDEAAEDSDCINAFQTGINYVLQMDRNSSKRAIFCVLDATNECAAPDRKQLVADLADAFQNKVQPTSRLRFVVSSRHYQDENHPYADLVASSSIHHLASENARVKSDIRKVIRFKFDEMLKRSLDRAHAWGLFGVILGVRRTLTVNEFKVVYCLTQPTTIAVGPARSYNELELPTDVEEFKISVLWCDSMNASDNIYHDLKYFLLDRPIFFHAAFNWHEHVILGGESAMEALGDARYAAIIDVSKPSFWAWFFLVAEKITEIKSPWGLRPSHCLVRMSLGGRPKKATASLTNSI
ncbi:hypothetical protein CGRA01v4_14855 [Colletotrichum graminicola]|nr:hypothetical protein CGRA01v4_14855 [Colletotrichum graminicola]